VATLPPLAARYQPLGCTPAPGEPISFAAMERAPATSGNPHPAPEGPESLDALESRLAQLRGLCNELLQREADLARRELALAERETTLNTLAARLRELQRMLASGELPPSAPPAPSNPRIDEITRERDELRRRLEEQELRLKRAGLEIEWALPAEDRRRKPR
jgi:hypothetical protein